MGLESQVELTDRSSPKMTPATQKTSTFESSIQSCQKSISQNLLKPNGFSKILTDCKPNIDMKNRAHVADTDHILRETIFNFLLENPEKVNGNSKNEKIVKTLKTILHNLFELTVREFYPVSETFQLYSMIFDMVTLKTAEEIFSILDDWHEFFKKDEKNRKEFFPAHAKKCTLRLCNDLLRRSSTTGSRDIKFSGKVQLFWPKFFLLTKNL